jgi:uncharacterized protein (TIGR03435 family)
MRKPPPNERRHYYMASHIRESNTVKDSRKKLLLNVAALVSVAVQIIFGMAHATPSHAQLQNQNAAETSYDYKYEVASIKAVQPGMTIRQTYQTTPHEFIASYISVQALIRNAYGLEDNQIFGAPNWLDSDMYETHAKTSDSVAEKLEKLSPYERNDAYREMLKALLADRFKLSVHRETKEMPQYELSIAKNGIKLQEAKPGDTYANGIMGANGPRGAGAIRSGTEVDGHKFIRAQGVPIAYLVSALNSELGSRVADQTGLTGKYDFTLRWMPETPSEMAEGSPASGAALSAASSGLPLLTAIQDELGLKMEQRKSRIDTVVIDHVERPSGN